ncbi:class I SAM-dependent DNA methyltransferase [Qingshengfaniella alkalisoli]|uniref:Class I SAM-dependent methyltransferase n=1 Tax=Qingshengfaniella alkalisoli TaxID=2599296 RepID=A0A5B8I6Y0_9RHOB|nr:class I SAM-dependent methyltransferase [Qingshengfaniella alkalisoli]QDY69385.1 class I SAM-dependent methyltransferase [Qingshengfaniella alkalisoli]
MPSTAADIVIDVYQQHAASWAELRGNDLVERSWLDAFLGAMPQDGREVPDIGCGTSRPIAGYLIANGCHVSGVDGAHALIDMARENFPDHLWITADMRDLPPLGRFHGLVAWHSFCHLTPQDQRLMFATFGRLTHPGATLLFTSGTTHGEAIGTFEGQPLYHGSLDSAEYCDLMQTTGFEVIRHIENDPTCGGATIWLARRTSDVG